MIASKTHGRRGLPVRTVMAPSMARPVSGHGSPAGSESDCSHAAVGRSIRRHGCQLDHGPGQAGHGSDARQFSQFDQIRRQILRGKAVNASRSWRAASRCSAALGNFASRVSGTCRIRAWTASASGCSKTVRSSFATHGWADFGTWESRLRAWCVRQRCHEAPGRTVPTASTRPALKSDRADTARNPTVSWRTRPTATARAANTCGAGASGTPSRRRPTGGPPAYAKAHAADGQ